MNKNTKKFLIIGSIEIAVLLIAFTFISIMNSNRVELESLYKTSYNLQYVGSKSYPELDKLIKFKLFRRFNNTRGLGVENPNTIIFIFPGLYGENERWYYEKMMMQAGKKGFGALLVDLLETPDFIPLNDENGIPYTVDGRRMKFLSVLSDYVEGCGFKKIIVWGFSSGGDIARKFANNSTLCIGTIDFFGVERDPENLILPEKRSLFIIGALDQALNQKKEIIVSLEEKAKTADLLVIPNCYEWLSNKYGEPENKAWDRAIESAFQFCSKL